MSVETKSLHTLLSKDNKSHLFPFRFRLLKSPRSLHVFDVLSKSLQEACEAEGGEPRRQCGHHRLARDTLLLEGKVVPVW